MSYLIDTNVISELRKPPPRRNSGVHRWFAQTDAADLYLSVLVVGEIRKGIETRRPHDPRQALALESWLGQLVSHFADRILPINSAIADRWGRAQCIRSFPVIDGLLAASAQEFDLQLVTRNVADLNDWPCANLLLNPFD